MNRTTNRARVPGLLILMLSCCVVPSAIAESDDQLRVLVWNAWRGGNEVESGPEKILRVIRDVDPDIVLMQESYEIDGDRPTLGRWLAEQLGWNAHQAESPHLCVLTPLEIEATFLHHPWHGLGVRVTDELQRSFVAWSIWLDYRSFITYQLRDAPELTDEELLAAEDVGSERVPQVEALLDHLEESGQMRLDVPLLVGGDWNTPSHLDWTTDTARIYRNRRALPLPVSRIMARHGFTDAFRSVHPNPVQRPGLTWSPMFRSGPEGSVQGFDRIDRLYLRNPSTAGWRLLPKEARVLPLVWEDDSTPPRQREFPSDHGAVLVDLQWSTSA